LGGGDGPGKSDRVETVVAFKEQEKGIMASPQEDINETESKVKFRVSQVQKVLLQESHEEINIGGGHPGSHGYGYIKIME
jgi:hypothetical protein